MPTVPTYPGAQIAPPGPSAPQVSGTMAPFQAIGRAVDAVQQINDERLKVFDEAAVKGLAVQRGNAARAILWGDEKNPGVLALEGQSALAALPDARKKLEELDRSLLGQAQGAPQQQMLGQFLTTSSQSDLDELARFEATQTQRYGDDQSLSYQALLKDQAARAPDPVKRAALIMATDGEIEALGKRKGWSPDEVKVKKLEASTDVWKTVVSGMMVDDPIGAAKLLEEHHDEIDQSTYEVLKDTVDKQGVQAQVLSKGDLIWVASGKSYAQAMALADQEKDPKVRLGLESRVGELAQREQTIQKLGQSTALDDGRKWMASGHPLSEMPAAQQQLLVAAGVWDTLSNEEKNLKAGTVPPKNGATYLGLQMMAADPKTAGVFRTMDLTPYASQMNPEDFSDLVKVQGGQKEAWGKAELETVNKIYTEAWPQVLLIQPELAQTNGQAKVRKEQTAARLKAIVLGQVKIYRDKGVDIGDKQMADIIRFATSDVSPAKGVQPFFSSPAGQFYALAPDSYLNLQKRLPGLTYDQLGRAFTADRGGKPIVPFKSIPAADRAELMKARPGVSEKTIELMYNDFLLGRPFRK